MYAESAAAEAAISHAAIVRPSSVRSRPAIRTAVARPDKTHRHGADRRSSHHRQHNAARTFHVSALELGSEANRLLRHCRTKGASPRRCFHRIVRTDQPPPEKCDVKACANDPKPPRVTVPEFDGGVPDADLLAAISDDGYDRRAEIHQERRQPGERLQDHLCVRESAGLNRCTIGPSPHATSGFNPQTKTPSFPTGSPE
jgi:hypothetical protein